MKQRFALILIIFTTMTTSASEFDDRVRSFMETNREFKQISKYEFVGPNANFPSIYDKDSDLNSFWKIDLFPGQPDQAFIVTPDCSDKTWSVSAPDSQGTFRYVIWNQPIADAHPAYIKFFCDTDYSRESEIWLCKKRRVLEMKKEPSDQDWLAINSECAK